MTIKHLIKKYLRRLGYDISRFNHENPIARRALLIRKLNISMVFDIGAYEGQYAKELRELGYKGRIHSFEPLSQAYASLIKETTKDSLWEGHNYALGDKNEVQMINVSENNFSSSLLPILKTHQRAAPNSVYTRKETVEVMRLDDVFSKLDVDDSNILLKIDAQGYEMNILCGAERSLENIGLVQLEVSLVPLYGSQELMEGICNFFSERSFAPIHIEPGFYNPSTGQLLQTDIMFCREENVRELLDT